MPYDISEMAMEDYDQVVEFWRAQEGLGLNESDSREHIARYLERNPGMSFVARDGGQVVGFVERRDLTLLQRVIDGCC